MKKQNSKFLILLNTLYLIRKIFLLYVFYKFIYFFHINHYLMTIIYILIIYSAIMGIVNIFYEYYSFHFYLYESKLLIVKGILIKTRYYIDYKDIISTAINRSFIYKIMNRYFLTINIGIKGEENLIKFRMITNNQLNNLKRKIQSNQRKEYPSINNKISYRLNGKAIAKSSLLFSNILMSIPIILNILLRLHLLRLKFLESLYFSKLFTYIIIIALIIIIIITIIHQYIIFYKFRLYRQKNNIYISNGIFNSSYNEFSIAQITTLIISESIVSKILGLCSAYVYITNSNKETNFNHKMKLLPYIEKRKLLNTVKNILNFKIIYPIKIRLNKMNLFIGIIYSVLLTLAFYLNHFVYVNPMYRYTLFFVYVFLYLLIANFMLLKYSFSKNELIFVNGIFNRKYHYVRYQNIIWKNFSQNPIQHLFGVYNIEIAVKKNPIKKIKLYNISSIQLNSLFSK